MQFVDKQTFKIIMSVILVQGGILFYWFLPLKIFSFYSALQR